VTILVVAMITGRTTMGDNTKVVQKAYEAFGNGDIPALLHLLDADVQWSSPKSLPHGGEFSGRDGVGMFFAGIGSNWSNLDVAVEVVGDLGADTVVGIVRADGARSGGGSDGYGAVHVFTVDNGKITRFREYVTDLNTALV
jgi:ketosteroid isomerase-like protein